MTVTRDDLFLTFKKAYESHINKLMNFDTLDEELLESLIDFLYDFKDSYETKKIFFCSHYDFIIKDFKNLKIKFKDSGIDLVLNRFEQLHLNSSKLFKPLYDLFILKDFKLHNKIFVEMFAKYNPRFKSLDFKMSAELYTQDSPQFLSNFFYLAFYDDLMRFYNKPLDEEFFINSSSISWTNEYRTNSIIIQFKIRPNESRLLF